MARPKGRYSIVSPPRERRVFGVSPARTSSYLGMARRSRDHPGFASRDLSMECAGDDQEIEVTVPTWRADVNDPVVLIEDVARMVGYDQIPVAPQPSMPSLGLRDHDRPTAASRLGTPGLRRLLRVPQSVARVAQDERMARRCRVIRSALSNWATREMSVLRRTSAVGPGDDRANQRSPQGAKRPGFSRSTGSSVWRRPSPTAAAR